MDQPRPTLSSSSSMMPSPSSLQSSGQRAQLGPSPLEEPPEDDLSPITRHHYHHHSKRASSAYFRHVQRVSKRAALASKRQFWDSNEPFGDAAQSAVDQWEALYNALRGLLVATAHSAQQVYGAAKTGANGLEHGLLVPVRDWVLLPAFGGVERLAGETVGFLQSDQAALLANTSLGLVKKVPYVGDNLLAPALCMAVNWAQKAWQIAQYPIPSRTQVRNSVDFVMTGTKWVLTTTGREVFFYVKRMDANITRTLIFQQWKVLGSGPYATLDKLDKRQVMDHTCERYLSLTDVVARYELAAHIRAHNRQLYHDLVLTGVLRERGGDLTKEDEWLSSCPSYRDLECPFFIGPQQHRGDDNEQEYHGTVHNDDPMALWFVRPNQNGQKPGRDVPWNLFSSAEREKLERRYHTMLSAVDQPVISKENSWTVAASHREGAAAGVIFKSNSHISSASSSDDTQSRDNSAARYATVAQWYFPDMENDVLVDRKRGAVSFFNACPKCRSRHVEPKPPLAPKPFGAFCDNCAKSDSPWVLALLSSPPLTMLMRPTVWRFYGPGDEVVRAVWFLDTKRYGLQPFGEEAQVILEDAYLFLKWHASKRLARNESSEGGDLDGALLTVQVASPDGSEQQLVQFSSLTQATAIQKGLAGAISLFKRRVYRGARKPVSKQGDHEQEWKQQQEADQGFPDLSSLSLQQPECEKPVPSGLLPSTEITDDHVDDADESEVVERESNEKSSSSIVMQVESLAVPPERIPLTLSGDDEKNEDIDHLVLIIHGIGEMLRSVDFFGLSVPNLSSIIDCCGFLRKNHAEIQKAPSAQSLPSKDETGLTLTGRVEYLPVEWHEAFSLQSQRQLLSGVTIDLGARGLRSSNATMNDISLRTIPQMRAFANDTLMDVLYFMSPKHHDIIIDIVTNELNYVVDRFRRLTGFNGRISLIGHSLGSIITWDILANQIPAVDDCRMQQVGQESLSELHPESFVTIEHPDLPQATDSTRDGYLSPLPMNFEDLGSSKEFTGLDNMIPNITNYPQLSFTVDNTFMLGSPIAVFLMIRNQQKPLSKEYYLPGCNRVFNIFHPFDPVAYRIEPLLDPRNADFEPKIMTHWNGGFRVHYQTKRLWKKLVDVTWKTQQKIIDSLEARIAGLGLLDPTPEGVGDDDEAESEISSDDSRARQFVAGQLNQGRRIDYMLQEKEIENANEYVAALAAHSSYWIEKDLSLFIAHQIYRSNLEDAYEAASRDYVMTPLGSVDSNYLH